MKTVPGFADREKELELLSNLAGSGRGHLLVLYGRRRVGKTSLLKEFLAARRRSSLYVYIDALKREDLIDQVCRDVARQTGTPVSFRAWEDLWRYLAGSLPSGAVAVIDEFQRLRTASPDALTSLQRVWDEEWRRRPHLVVLMGSSVGLVRRLAADARGALHGRATRILHLRPFRYAQARALLRGSEVTRVETYAVFGGTPHYLTLALGTRGTPLEKVRRLVLDPAGPLREEPINVLAAELREPEKYLSILRASALGKVTLKDMSDKSGIPMHRLGYYLGALENLLDVVARDEPVLGGKRSGRYRVVDPFFRFWFRFVHRNRAALEIGDIPAVLAAVRQGLPAYVGTCFEEIVRELVAAANHRRLGGVRLDVTAVGGWWDRRGNEIDVCAPMRDGSVLLGEVTWSGKAMTAGDVEGLRRKAELVRPGSRKRLLLAGRRVDATAREAMGRDGAVLDLDDVAREFAAASPKGSE